MKPAKRKTSSKPAATGSHEPAFREIIGLCASKDNEVVEYALSRSVSPALIAEYQTRRPDRGLLQRKLREFYQLAMPRAEADIAPTGRKRK